MVERDLRGRGITDERVLEAMGLVPRERFVLEDDRDRAYDDRALPIGYGQTISQPWIVARMFEALALEDDERVLEVGTGSGYSTAVLARLVAEVVSIELVEQLSQRAQAVLAELSVPNARLYVGDGSMGLPDAPDFDAIAVHATAPAPPSELIGRLVIGGRLVVPVAAGSTDLLTLYTRTEAEFDLSDGRGLRATPLGSCRFVPLIGEAGFAPGPASK
jgi:protein-L-isoaspartate(D-aspartate) O-methyltransferase